MPGTLLLRMEPSNPIPYALRFVFVQFLPPSWEINFLGKLLHDLFSSNKSTVVGGKYFTFEKENRLV